MSRLGLSFVAFYIAVSVASVNHAFHFNNFKSLAVWLSLPVAFVPQEIYTLLTNLNNSELLSSKELYLVKLTSQYPIGMAFMAIFLYAWGWSISNAFQSSKLYGYKFMATFLGGYATGCLLFSKWFISLWPLFIIAGFIVSWRTLAKPALTHPSSGTGESALR
jgi:hypothetical protein